MDGGKGSRSLSTAARKKKETIPPPFPWMTDRRAVVRSKDYLLFHGISAISGDVECKKCKNRDVLVYDLQLEFKEMAEFVAGHLEDIDAPEWKKWMRPALPGCSRCGETGCVAPVVADKKRDINWLFLFFGRMLGVCTDEQLGYFCKHNRVYPTAREDRLLLFVYVGICLQLDPFF